MLLKREEMANKPEPQQESVIPAGAIIRLEVISSPISVLSKDISVEQPDDGSLPAVDDVVSFAASIETDESLSTAKLFVPEVLASAEIELHVDIHWAAGFLNMSKRTVERYVKKGLITAIKYPSGQVYFLKSHLEELAELKKQSGLEYKDLVSTKNKSELPKDIEPPQSTML